MHIKELSDIEIKALLYDSSIEMDRIQHNSKMLRNELTKRQEEGSSNPEPQTEPKEKKKQEPKK